jgi:excisionase family DNA binding protein
MTKRIEMAAEERWVGVDDVATHLGVAKDSVYRWIEEQGLPAHRVGRLFRFKLSEIDNWVRQDNEQKKAQNSVQDKLPSKSQARKSTAKKTSRKRGGNG